MADLTVYEQLEMARNYAAAHNLMAGKASRLIQEILGDLPQTSAAWDPLIQSRSLLLDALETLDADYRISEENLRVEAERSL